MASLATVSDAAEGLTKLITKLFPQDFNGLRGGKGEERERRDARSRSGIRFVNVKSQERRIMRIDGRVKKIRRARRNLEGK